MQLDLQAEAFAFYDWLETNPLGTSCIALWHAFMHIAIKAGCPDKFAVAVSVLEAKTGLKRDALYDARNKLQQAGRIKWETRKGNQSALYQICPFVSDKPTQIPTQKFTEQICVGITDANTHTNPTQAPTQIATIKDVIVDNIVVALPNDFQILGCGAKAIALAEEYWKRELEDDEKALICSWFKYFGDQGNKAPDEMVIKAIEQSIAAQAEYKLLYVKAMIECWQDAGIADLEGVDRLNQAHRSGRKASGQTKRRNKVTPLDQGKGGKYNDFYLGG